MTLGPSSALGLSAQVGGLELRGPGPGGVGRPGVAAGALSAPSWGPLRVLFLRLKKPPNRKSDVLIAPKKGREEKTPAACDPDTQPRETGSGVGCGVKLGVDRPSLFAPKQKRIPNVGGAGRPLASVVCFGTRARLPHGSPL